MAGSVLLVVVDDPAHRALFNRFLANTPHHVIFSRDGEDGFDRFAEVKPDLIIAHVNAPRLDGTILCQLVRQQPRGDQVPFVLLSEEFKKPEAGRERVEVVGADDFLPCPFDRRTLIEKITPLLAFGRPELPAPPEVSAPVEAPSRASSSTDLAAIGNELSDAVQAIEQAVHDTGSLAEEPLAERTGEDDLLGEEPIAPPRGPTRPIPEAQDTVVSFQNPYASVDISHRPPIVTDSSGEDVDEPRMVSEASTHIHVEEKPTLPFESQRIYTGEPEFDEVPKDDEREQLLEEPQISNLVPRVPDHSVESSEKARLLHEPSREGTPSASDKKKMQQGDHAVRRGLDESQLGKRLAKRVRTMYRLLDEVDYYQVLGVEPDVSLEQLQRAYFDLSLEFHPDRFFLLRSGDLKEKIYAIYRRITEAYTVLIDERRRDSYDATRASGSTDKRAAPDLREERVQRREGPPAGRTMDVPVRDARAKRSLEHAKVAFAEGDMLGARLHLHLAQSYEGDSRELRAAIENVARLCRPS